MVAMASQPCRLAQLMHAPRLNYLRAHINTCTQHHTLASSLHVSSAIRRALHTAQAASVSIPGPLEYCTLAQPTRTEVEVKKSRFLVTAWPVISSRQAMALIKEHSDPAASHNCFAYRVGDEYRSSDDGEPGGTAGRPILAAIEGEDLGGVAVLVTRYYGGVKLGAGGLVRAYGGAARTCLRAAPRATVRARAKLKMQAGFELLGVLYNLLDKYECERLSEEYKEGGVGNEGGAVVLVVSVDAGTAPALIVAVSDATSGAVVPEQVAGEGRGEGDEEQGAG